MMSWSLLIYNLVYPVEMLDVVVFCVEQKTSRPRCKTCI